MRQDTQQQTVLDGTPKDRKPIISNVNLGERAQSYIDQGLYQEAIEIFDVANVSVLESMISSIRLKLPFEVVHTIIGIALEAYPKNASIRSEFGWLYYSNEQYNEAIEVFDKVLRTDQNYAPALQGRIASLRLLRRFPEAHKLLHSVAKRFPEHFGIQSELGWLYFDQKQHDKAFRVFEEVYKKGDSAALKWAISCLRSQRRFPEAEDWIRTALRVLPNDVEILNEKGWFHFDKKEYVRAFNAFNEALGIDERHEFALQGKIASLRRQQKFQEAQELLHKVSAWHGRSTGILSERGWLLLDQKQYSKAAGSFEDAVKLLPNRIALKYSQIEALIAINHGYQALEVLKELKQRFPDDIEVMERLGRFYLRRNDLKSAEKEFRAILDLEKNNVLGLNGIGAVYFSQARYSEATKILLRVVEADPKNPLWYTNLARALVRQEDVRKPRRRSFEAFQFWEYPQENQSALAQIDEAERYCKKALELDPKSADAYGCLGIIEFKRGNPRESEELFLNSIDLDPQEGSYRDLGALYVTTKRHDEAETMLKRALENNKDDALAHLELGYLYLQTENLEKALQEFHQAMVIDPNNDESPRAVATVLMRNQSFDEAESVLRKALGALDRSRQWQIHLTLSRLLIQKGDETEDSQFYDEALVETKIAKRIMPNHADPYYHTGIILAKQKDYRGALKNFRLCLSKNRHHNEAERNITKVRSYIRGQRSGSHFWGGFCVGVLSLSQLILLWYFFSQNKVTATILSVLIPVLLGLVVVGFLMPVLIKFKVAGLEVGFSEQKEPIYQGPKGGIGFSFASPTISSGPR